MKPPSTRKSRVRFSPQRERTAQRGYDSDHRRWRKAVLRKHPFCVFCRRQGIIEPSVVADHITPIQVNPDLRLDVDNGRGLCQRHHSIISARFRDTGINELPNEIATLDPQLETRQ